MWLMCWELVINITHNELVSLWQKQINDFTAVVFLHFNPRFRLIIKDTYNCCAIHVAELKDESRGE